MTLISSSQTSSSGSKTPSSMWRRSGCPSSTSYCVNGACGAHPLVPIWTSSCWRWRRGPAEWGRRWSAMICSISTTRTSLRQSKTPTQHRYLASNLFPMTLKENTGQKWSEQILTFFHMYLYILIITISSSNSSLTVITAVSSFNSQIFYVKICVKIWSKTLPWHQSPPNWLYI